MTWDGMVSKRLNMACFPHYRMFLCLTHINTYILISRNAAL
jgi:hypothetical protein